MLGRPKVNRHVCPECGAEAGGQPFCAGCGCNLAGEQRLLSREEWEAQHDTTAVGQRSRSQRWIIPLALMLGAAAVAVAVTLALDGSKTVRAPSNAGVRLYRVPSGSMEPTLAVGTQVTVEESATSLEVGDIVVFHPPEGAVNGICGPSPHQVTPGGAACASPVLKEASITFIKRVVAGPGDTIYIKEGHVYLNGEREKDSYIRECGESSECSFPTPIKIPRGSYYLLGDNRGNSEDSRFWGAVPRSWIIGKVIRNDGRGAPGLRGF